MRTIIDIIKESVYGIGGVLGCVIIIACVGVYLTCAKKDAKIAELEQQVAIGATKISEVENDNKELKEQYEDELEALQSNIDDLQSRYDELKSQYNALLSQFYDVSGKYMESQRELSLLDEYSYALYDTEGRRNDLSLELIELGDNLMRENNLDPNILFGIIMVESEGHADLVDHRLEASGLGQFLEGTGEFVCSSLMDGEIDYDHSTTPFDPEINIRMMVTYLSWLSKKYDNVTIDMIQQYCGGSDANTQRYYNKLSRIIGYRP